MSAELREKAVRLLQGDYFVALGIGKNATTEEIGKAYIAAAKIYHPDRAPNEELRTLFTKVFARLDLAKTTLADPQRRAAYMQELSKPATSDERTAAEASLEFKKADALLKKNNAVGAEYHLRRAVALVPANVEYAALLISIQAKPDATPERLAELAKELDVLVKKAPEFEKAIFYRGQIRKRLARDAEAYADFTRAAELNPANIDASREVRLYKMRKGEKVAQPVMEEAPKGGFFNRLFKR